MKRRDLFVLLAVIALPWPAATHGAEASEKETAKEKISILFIGNSYTNGMRKTFDQLIAHEKLNAHVEYHTPGGRTLKQHFANAKVIEKIKSRKWHFVVLQEQSQTPAYLRAKFYAAATDLDKVIRARGAKTVFFMTWGRRDGDKRNPKLAPDYATMQKKLTEAYSTIAAKLKARQAPVGLVWQEVRKLDDNLGKALYAKDGSHPSGKGAYLAATVFYCTLFDTKPQTLTFTAKLNAQDVKTIRQAASNVLGPKKKSAESK